MAVDRPRSTEVVLRASVGGDEPRRVVLDPAFQGLPDTAHGGSVLALFDALASSMSPRVLSGVYRRRVPLNAPLSLAIEPGDDATAFRLSDADALLVEGVVAPADRTASGHGAPDDGRPASGAGAAEHLDVAAVTALAGGAAPITQPLPISRTCLACGIDNPLGLHAQLFIDEQLVGGIWQPGPGFRSASGDRLAPLAVTTLLDEAAFWLGAAAAGESGMTTELRVRLHPPLAFAPVYVAGRRPAVRARARDPRYWDTAIVAFDSAGRLMASADITFVAVRGAARKLCAGLLALNPPEVLRRVFPAYVR
jgi:hypothetical protein